MGTTNHPEGETNVAQTTTLGKYGAHDPTKYHTWFEDFNQYDVLQWVHTAVEAGAGSSTVAGSDANGGILLMTNAANEDDGSSLQLTDTTAAAAVENFLFTAGKEAWFKCRFKTLEVIQSDWSIGLMITDTDPAGGVSDGVYFKSVDGAAAITFEVEKDSTATSTAVGTAVATVYQTLGFHYDGVSAIEIFMNDVKVGTSVVTNLPDDEELTVSFAHINGAASVNTMSIDYIFVAMER